MNWRLPGLLAALCLISACKEEPAARGLEPLPRPAPASATPPAGTPPSPAQPPEDPSKVLLRWKLAAPTAYQLTASTLRGAPAPATKAPARGKARVRKSKKQRGAPAPEAEAPPEAPPPGGDVTFFLLHAGPPTSGALPFALLPEAPRAPAQQGKMSERGFVLEGLSGPVRNLAAMVLELPSEPVGPGTTWTLTTNLVDEGALPPGFRQKDSKQTNEVKLLSLTPAEDGEQVATLEYDLLESVTGQQGRVRRSRRGHHAHEHENAPVSVKKNRNARNSKGNAQAAEAAAELSAEVRVHGRGEFLVKAGHWRSWEVTLTTRTQGLTLPGLTPGERVLRLTPVEPVPETLLQRVAKK